MYQKAGDSMSWALFHEHLAAQAQRHKVKSCLTQIDAVYCIRGALILLVQAAYKTPLGYMEASSGGPSHERGYARSDSGLT
jgi:hypothetical protein